jgi:hypothetical protein
MTFAPILHGFWVVFGVVLVLLVWFARRTWRSRTIHGNRPGCKLALLGVPLLFVLVWIGWEFQPWVHAGRGVWLSSAHMGDYDFQVWQRKNDAVSEPFATALFVRRGRCPWTAYLLDIQDTYRPSMSLRKESSGVAILYGKTRRAHFDEGRGVLTLYHWDGGSDVIEGVVIDPEPPDDWWQRLTKTR